MGWLMCKKHPEVIRCGKMIDCSDLLADPIVYYQRKYTIFKMSPTSPTFYIRFFYCVSVKYRFFLPLFIIFNYILPTFVPWYFWGESLATSFFSTAILRNVCILHLTWSVNSFAHLWGSHPYDKYIIISNIS